MKNILPKATYFPFLAHMVVSRNCNLNCGYCSEYDKTATPVPVSQLKRQIDLLHKFGLIMLTITGGEPLLHPGLFEVLDYAKGKFLILQMITNGYLLTQQAVEKLDEAHLTIMEISIDGVYPNQITVKALEPLNKSLRWLPGKQNLR